MLLGMFLHVNEIPTHRDLTSSSLNEKAPKKLEAFWAIKPAAQAASARLATESFRI